MITGGPARAGLRNEPWEPQPVPASATAPHGGPLGCLTPPPFPSYGPNGYASAPPAQDGPRVVLADGDPISRQVLGATLGAAANVRLMASMDSRTPVRDWPETHPDLAILVAGPQEDHLWMAQELVANEVSALLVGVDWTKHRLDAAFAFGVAGCLTKDWAVTHLGAAASAAASGYVVLSPDLLKLYVSGFLSGNGGQTMKAATGGRSLKKLLGGLTLREREVLALLSDGMSTDEVSTSLAISAATVKSHVSHSLAKLGVRNRLEAVLLMQAALGCGIDRTPVPDAVLPAAVPAFGH
ncbi:LuxR C-terminal-related transcriptional regulator [Sphaerisporangium sp. TRM90804]|nr:LuxR C-terminal-related transcriptional regulator [Sphaerisporangium sp. TRM90804]